ncbi:ATP-binding protein [Patescibacteria group bacterium]|nr:ATP-binding protein [Patescibacteria group bacterium]
MNLSNLIRRSQTDHTFCFGEQNQLSLVSYAGLEEQPDFIVIDGQYLRTLYLSGYPYVAHSGWLDNLINFNRNVDISFHIEEIDAISALPKLQRKITELESTKRAMIKDGRIVGSDITDPLESATLLRDKIQRGQEKLFQISVYICLLASSLSELDKLTRLLENTLAARLFFVKAAHYQQLDGLQSVLPRGEDRLKQKRNLDSSSAALSFPFISSELVAQDGILYGVNKSNNSLVMLDRFALNNANSITFAQSGSGKSYAAKVEILRQLMLGTDCIVIDPEREYSGLAQSVGGTVIELSVKSEQHINPFAIGSLSKKSNLNEYVQDFTELISLMAEGLNAQEKSIVDRIILEVYDHTSPQSVTLQTFYNYLKKHKAIELCRRLDKYVSGSLANVFNNATNIDLGNRLVVFDIKDLPDNLRQIMIMMISSFVWNRVKQEPKKRLLVIDEGWLLLEHEQSARFVAGLVRRSRKYYLGVAIISQQANDFLNNEFGKAIASQSALRILMRQDTTTITNVIAEFRLSEYEQNFLLTCDRGDALIIADLNHVALSIVASATEHPLITTDPKELFAK